MKKFLTVFLVAILMLSFATTTFAADMPARSGKQTSAHPEGAVQKGERGFANLALGWSEIPKGVVEETKASGNPIQGLVFGGFKGIFDAFARTMSGAFEVATFPVGKYDKPAVQPDMTQSQ